MADFSPSDAAFEGFRLTRERPLAVLAWSLVNFVLYVLVIIVLIRSGAGAAMEEFIRTAGKTPSQEAIIAVSDKFTPVSLVALPLLLAATALIEAAVNRMVQSPGVRTPALALGGDEIRALGAKAFSVAAVFGVYFVGILGIMILGSLGGILGQAVGALAASVGVVAMLAGVFYVAVRLSLLVPHAVCARRIAPREALALTKGRFWALLGAYVLSIMFWLIVFFLFSIILNGVEAATGALKAQPDLSSIAGYFTAPRILGLVFEAVLGGMGMTLLIAPSAWIYRQVDGQPMAEPPPAVEV